MKYTVEKIKLRNVPDSATHFVLFCSNGEKKEEYYHKKDGYCDTLRRWDRFGELYHMEVHTDTGFTETDRYMEFTETGSYRRIKKIPEFRIIDDSSTWTRYTRSEIRAPYYVRTGTWRTFFESGRLGSEGKYLPEQFDVACPDGSRVIKKGFDSEKWLNKDGTRFSGMYAGCTTYLKDGEWTYYNETGKETHREFYKDGIKQKQP